MVAGQNSKTVIVTGGAGGLGLAIVQAFLAQGANVVATDIQDTLLEALPASIDEQHRERLLPYKCDSTDDEAVKKLVADAVAKFGRLDVLVNNAGVMDKMAPTGDCTRETWDFNLRVNLTGPFITSQNAIKQFLDQELVGGQRGIILNVISTAGNHGARAGHDAAGFHAEGMALTMASCATWGGEAGKGGWNLGMSPLDQVAKTVTVLCSEGMNTINGALVPADMGWASI
ncbi:hypothetical protein ACHAQA_009015 [Verticillium albo-atrum]